MKTQRLWLIALAAVGFLTGCESLPPGAERGPHGTMAFLVPVEASVPGTKIYANGHEAGVAPLTLKIFGDKDGTFHDFGAYEFVVQAVPSQTNQHVQTKVFQTGRMFSPEDKIPERIVFNMDLPPTTYVPVAPPSAYYYPPPAYYYGWPHHYYGPQIYLGPRFHHHHRLHRHR